VIADLNADRMEDADKPTGEPNVLRTWLIASPWMVVRHDHCACIQPECPGYNVSKRRTDLISVSIAVPQMCEHAVVRVEKDAFHLFEFEGREGIEPVLHPFALPPLPTSGEGEMIRFRGPKRTI
jgi:hypothetical protein